MDALRLNYRAKDELHPLLASVITSVDAVTKGEEFDGRKDIVRWLIALNQMRPGDEIDETQGREMLWDLERGYNSFLEGLG
jgi:ESCRT-I complex subunit VPS28